VITGAVAERDPGADDGSDRWDRRSARGGRRCACERRWAERGGSARGKRATERVALGSACWAAVPLAERGKGGRKLGWRTRHGEGVSGLCGSEPSGVSWAERES